MWQAIHILMMGSLVFLPPEDRPDVALGFGIPANAKADPVRMPRAEAYLVSSGEGRRLEDRFDVFDLWKAESLRGRWRNADGDVFSICRIRRRIPGDSGDEMRTRSDYGARYAKARLGPKSLDSLDEAAYLLAPVDVTSRVAPRRSMRKNLSALWRYETTNENAFVYAFMPRLDGRVPPDWYLVSLVSGDPEAGEKIDEWLDDVVGLVPEEETPVADCAEHGLLARDYRRSVANYGDWHFSQATNLVIVDDMDSPDRGQLMAALTNGFPKMQAAYREALPSPLLEDSHIAAIRVFGSKEEYLAYVGVEMKWSAALWSPNHRELVMYYPEGGVAALVRTVWHEALHQHLDYACSMIQTPPWFNEGHAVLFENTHFSMDGDVVFDTDIEAAAFVQAHAGDLGESMNALFDMDYPEFYSGDDDERRLKYRLAWSMAYFLQVGAPRVRFQPFKNLRHDVMEATVRTQRRDEVARTVLTSELRENLVSEWTAFWKKQ